MDPRLLEYYERELQHLREVGSEFATEHPKIAGRLGLDTFECSDPYVERLFEGFAFLAARVQLKVDAEFPNFTQQLLNIIYPHYLSATPSMTVVEFRPDLTEDKLMDGVTIPRHTTLRSKIGKGAQTACEYLTGHDLQLWPIEVSKVDYLPTRAAITSSGISNHKSLDSAKAAILIGLRTTINAGFNQLSLDKLQFYLRGSTGIPYRLYEQLIANSQLIACKFTRDGQPVVVFCETKKIRGMGFVEDEALLRQTPRSFSGYRMLQEYFAFPERYLFVEFSALSSLLSDCDAHELELLVILDRSDEYLFNALDKSNFALFCVPTINLFVKRTDRIHLDQQQSEYHVVVDRSRPQDFEVYSINEIVGYGSEQNQEQTFLPFYGSQTSYKNPSETAFYTLRRLKRLLSSRQKREGVRSSYIGSEVFISLVDAAQAPYSTNLTQLGLEILCTNRDLPLIMPVGIGDTDFSLQISAPVKSIHCISGPTRPIPATYDGENVWKLINHLSLNYLSLIDRDAQQGAEALRSLLELYADNRDATVKKQIAGVVSINAKNIVRRMDIKGPLVFGRGLEITVVFDETAFVGGGYFLLGTVLERFFAHYVSINSFVETVICTTDRGEVARWPVRIGHRHSI